jgi:putative aminopeptidase FrvX
MSYHPIKIAHLSHDQTLKILKGHPTTIKRGMHHTLHVGADHYKKFSKLGHGKGMRIQLDPHLIHMNSHIHGQGFFSALKKGASAAMANPAIKNLAKQGAQMAIQAAVAKASPYAEQYGLQGALASASDMASQHVAGMGVHRLRHVRPKKVHMGGAGMFGNIAKMGKAALKNPAIRSMVTTAANNALASQGLPPMAESGLSMAGLGIRKRGRPRKHPVGTMPKPKPRPRARKHTMGGALFLA